MDNQALIQTYGNTALPEGTPDRPLVTFALFAFNQEKYIREAVEGAFSQTYSPLEIILSDDCSSDHTYDIIEEMARGYQGPHKLVVRRHGENLGLFRHFMSVCGTSAGAITVVAAGDDLSLPHRTSEIVKALCGNSKFAAVCSTVERIDQRGVFLGTYSPPLAERVGFLYGSMDHILGCSAAYVTEYIREIPKSDLNDIAEDAFLSHAFQMKGLRIARIADPLVRYRVAENNLSIIETAGFGYADYMSMENRKKRRLMINYNTLISIDKYSRLVDEHVQQQPVNRDQLLRRVKKLSLMIRVYRPRAILDWHFVYSALADIEILKFAVPRIIGLRFSYILFFIRESIRSMRRSGRIS